MVGNRRSTDIRLLLAALVAALALMALFAAGVATPAGATGKKKAHDAHDGRGGWDPPGRGGRDDDRGHGGGRDDDHGHHGDHDHGHGGGHGGGRRPDEIAYVPSTPENTVLGGFPIGNAPVETVRSGQIVKIDTLTQQGATSATTDPVTYYARFGVPASGVLPDMIAFQRSLADRPRYGGHILTGPVYVDGAEPGDTLEVQILDLKTRVPYGVNSTSPTSGVFSTTYPGWRTGDLPLNILPEEGANFYRTGMFGSKEVAFFNNDIQIPLQKFMGTMAVASPEGVFVGNTPDAPPPALGVQPSTPPGPYGGNLDTRDLTAGSSLFLPVFQSGARFYTGDPHSLQGNGEVSGTAIEQSLQGTFRFIVHKGEAITGPAAEDRDNYIVMGIDHDLDRAMKLATANMVRFLVLEKGFTEAKALSFASLAGDFQVAEVVDRTQVVVGKIPKYLFD